MRILNIYYKNINSLEGEGRVHFDQGPIADSGVFAITGPNGSGKTSILDVITLGLYGETFRFDKPAQHVITKHADESLAQVEFALGDEKYRSSWQVKRADTALPEMTLMRLNGEEEILAETPGQVRSRLTELTGMDFHRFSKSIVIPQGDFAAFLNALDSERMDILEKISGTDLYADYRRQAETRHAALKEKVTLLEHEVGLVPLLSAEAIEAAEHDLQDFQDQSNGLKKERQALQDQLVGLQNIEALQKQHRQLDEQQRLLKEEIHQHQQELRRIEANPQVSNTFREDLRLLDAKLAEAEQSRATLSQYRSELSMLQQQLATTGDGETAAIPTGQTLEEQRREIDALKIKISEIKLELPRETELGQAIQHQLAGNKASLAEVEDWLKAHQADAVLLSDFPEVAQLRNLRTELAEMAGQQKTQGNWSKNTSAALKKSKDALTATEDRLEELKNQIEADQKALRELAQGKSLEELNEVLLDQQSRVANIQELYSLADVNAKLSKKGLFSWFGRDKDLDLPDEAQLQAHVDALKLEMSSDENISATLQQAIANEALLKRLSEYRNKLVDDKPCFLCGSLKHPYVTKPPVMTDSRKALADHRAKMQTLKSRLDNAINQLNAAQKRSSQLTAKQKFLQQKRSEWSVLANRLNLMRADMVIDNLSLQKTLLQEETEELEKIKHLVKEHTQLQRNIAKANAEIKDKQSALVNLRSSTEQLNATWAERSPEVQELEKKFTQRQADLQALTARLEKQLSLLNEKLPRKGKENAIFDRLNSRRQDYQIRELRQKGLQGEIASLQEKLQICQATIVRYQQQLTDSLEALRGAEGLGLHLAVLEKQKLIVAMEQQLANQEMELDVMRRGLSDKIAEHGFSDLDELTNLLKLIDRQTEIRRFVDEQSARLTTVAGELLKLQAQLQSESATIADTVSEADLRAAQRQINEQIDIAEQEVHTLQNKLDKQQQYRDKYQTLETELAEQRRLLADSDADINQINDGQGGFRRMIQQLLIDKLLSQTNQILEKISGRYYLRSATSEHGLALEIEDTKQKNARRLPKTLSGGESFVVSLALALALAEMANNGKAIESLFLDEGFGNLDAEALYLAMGALEGLKIQGKTVGVISHVEGVKKRIKTQIELVKKPNGLSELRMVA
ncbi:MAG: AAA family ATPase [Methylococcaceae bacterium]|nr:AAA family ATPase [Methylococcaceae bacterium]